MNLRDEKQLLAQVQAIHDQVVGRPAVPTPAASDLIRAARRVAWARRVKRNDGWDLLKEAIGQLEDIVGVQTEEPV